jgi:hypothetical protein
MNGSTIQLAAGRGQNVVDGNSKLQISNNKWFDKLTTLSKVEGQITITEIQNFKLVWVIKYWNLEFICDLVLGVWDFSIRIGNYFSVLILS